MLNAVKHLDGKNNFEILR